MNGYFAAACVVCIALIVCLGIIVVDVNQLRAEVDHLSRTPTINIEYGYVYPMPGDLVG